MNTQKIALQINNEDANKSVNHARYALTEPLNFMQPFVNRQGEETIKRYHVIDLYSYSAGDFFYVDMHDGPATSERLMRFTQEWSHETVFNQLGYAMVTLLDLITNKLTLNIEYKDMDDEYYGERIIPAYLATKNELKYLTSNHVNSEVQRGKTIEKLTDMSDDEYFQSEWDVPTDFQVKAFKLKRKATNN